MPIFQPHSHIQLPFIQPHQQHTQYLSPTTHTQQSPPTTLTKTYPTNQTTHNIINHHPLQTTLQSTPKYSRPPTTINPSINTPNIHHHTPQSTHQSTHQSTPPIFKTTHHLISTPTTPINQYPNFTRHNTPYTTRTHTHNPRTQSTHPIFIPNPTHHPYPASTFTLRGDSHTHKHHSFQFRHYLIHTTQPYFHIKYTAPFTSKPTCK